MNGIFSLMAGELEMGIGPSTSKRRSGYILKAGESTMEVLLSHAESVLCVREREKGRLE